MSSTKKIILTTFLFIFSLFYLLIGSLQKINIYDEGFILYNSFNVLNGQIPYRDFWTLYTPGQYYLLAIFFKIFGSYVIVNRLLDDVVRFILAGLIFIISRKIASYKYAVFSYLISIFMLGSIGFYGYPLFSALAFSFTNVYLLFKFINTKALKVLFISGLITGITVLFKHEIGFYTLLNTEFLLVVVGIIECKRGKTKLLLIKIMKTFFKRNLIFLLGTAIIVIPVLLYFYTKVDLKILWNDLIGYNIYNHSSARFLPFPSFFPKELAVLPNYTVLIPYVQAWIGFYYPLLIYTYACIYIYLSYKSKYLNLNEERRLLKICILVSFGLLLFVSSLTRADTIHYLPSTIVAIVLSLSFMRFKGANTGIKIPYAISIILLLITVLNIFINNTFSNWEVVASSKPFFTNSANIKPASFIPVDQDQKMAIQYIDTVVPKDGYIYVGLPRHDKVFVNDISFYFLAKRESPSMYYELDPGIITTVAIQRNIIRSLKAKHVNFIVLFSKYSKHFEPNSSSKSSGVKLLDAYISQNYEQIKNFGNYSVLLKH